jgi:ATP-dependent DNA ligase
VALTSRPPKWIKPQLTRLVDGAPVGDGWLHEIKYDGYRMHARIDGDSIKLLTRTGLDWAHRYKRTKEALGSLKGLPRWRAMRALSQRSALIQPAPGDGR